MGEQVIRLSLAEFGGQQQKEGGYFYNQRGGAKSRPCLQL